MRGTRAATPDRLDAGLGSRLNRWESYLVVFIAVLVVVMSSLSPYFLSLEGLLYATSDFSEKALIALPLALVILVRDIDVSIASVAAFAAVCVGLAAEHGIGTPGLYATGCAAGLGAGLLNGLLVTRLGIPSIVVTIGTLSLFRGLAVVLVGERALTVFPAGFDAVGQGLWLDLVPYSFLVLLGLALVFGLFLHTTTHGHRLFAIGSSPDAARHAGVRVDGYRLMLFALTGTVCGLAGTILTSRLLSVRLNVATGWELEIITMVVLGGVSITGGKGSVPGVLLAVIVIGLLTFGLSLLNVPSIIMSIFVGALLIAAIGLPNLVQAIGRRRAGSAGRVRSAQA